MSKWNFKEEWMKWRESLSDTHPFEWHAGTGTKELVKKAERLADLLENKDCNAPQWFIDVEEELAKYRLSDEPEVERGPFVYPSGDTTDWRNFSAIYDEITALRREVAELKARK